MIPPFIPLCSRCNKQKVLVVMDKEGNLAGNTSVCENCVVFGICQPTTEQITLREDDEGMDQR